MNWFKKVSTKFFSMIEILFSDFMFFYSLLNRWYFLLETDETDDRVEMICQAVRWSRSSRWSQGGWSVITDIHWRKDRDPSGDRSVSSVFVIACHCWMVARRSAGSTFLSATSRSEGLIVGYTLHTKSSKRVRIFN